MDTHYPHRHSEEVKRVFAFHLASVVAHESGTAMGPLLMDPNSLHHAPPAKTVEHEPPRCEASFYDEYRSFTR